jgi:hypothetical protein
LRSNRRMSDHAAADTSLWVRQIFPVKRYFKILLDDC